MKRRFKTAFILGAGLGIRLRPYTYSVPKPLVNLCGKPLLCYILDGLIKWGFERFIINTHYAHEAYLRFFPDLKWRGKELILRYEPLLLDTGGALKNIEDLLSYDSAILCHNGDILTTIPYKRIIEAHETERPYFTLALRSEGPDKHICLDENGCVVDIRDRLKKKNGLKFQFLGIYAVETECLKYIEPKKPISLVDILLEFIEKEPRKVKGVIVEEGKWYEVGTKESYERIQKMDINAFLDDLKKR